MVRGAPRSEMGTFLTEGTGAVVLTLCFLPRYGFLKGLWRDLHAVSAFCNAGSTCWGTEGGVFQPALCQWKLVVLLTIMALITIGGLGFLYGRISCSCGRDLRRLSLSQARWY